MKRVFAILTIFTLVGFALAGLKPASGAAGADRLNQIASQILQLSNQARQQEGAKPLAAVEHLAQAAHGHSDEMLKLDYFNHLSPTPGRSKPLDRVQLAGGIELQVAENIYEAFGYPPDEVAQAAVGAFLKSPGHRRNLLNPEYNSLGVGVARLNDKTAVTQVFARRLIALEKLDVKPSGSGFEVSMTCRVLEGERQGAVFFNSSPVQRFTANGDGIFSMQFKVPSAGAVQIAQPAGGRFTIGAQFQLPR